MIFLGQLWSFSGTSCPDGVVGCKELVNKAHTDWMYADKKWFEIPDGGSGSNLKVVDSRQVLTIDPTSPADGDDVTLEDRIVDDTQKWQKVSFSENFFFLQNVQSSSDPYQNYLTANSAADTKFEPGTKIEPSFTELYKLVTSHTLTLKNICTLVSV